MNLAQRFKASRFIGISTLFVYPFVRRTKRFNFPHSIEPFVPVHSAVLPNISSSAIVDAAIVATLPLMRHALIARIRSRASVPFSHPTAHRWDACAHYTRRRRYASAFYAHLNRLPLDLFLEVRPLGVRRIFPLACAALVNLTPSCASVFGHPIGAVAPAYNIVSICPCARCISPSKQQFGHYYI